MASYFPAKINTAWIGYIGLVSQADTKLLLASPTIAAGDFKVSIDGGALNNLTTLPTVTPAAGYRVKISLSAAEMNGENISVSCIDAAGAEWCSLLLNIPTSTRQIDDLATPTNITAGTITTATNVTTVNGLAANVITAASIATDAIDGDAIAASAVTEIQSGLATAAALLVVDDFLDTEIADIQARLPAALIGGRIDANMGAISSDAIAADNAEAFFDGTGYAGTGNTIPTVITVGTLTTYTGNTPQTGDSFTRIGALGAGLTSLASQSSVNTIDDFLDTEIAAIKAKTDSLTFTIPGQVDSNVLTGGGSGLDAAATRAALGLASANLDTQLGDIPTAIENRAEMDSNSTQLIAIKAKTDSLTFTVAGQVDSNIQYVNDVQVDGTGATGDEWGPV